MKIIIIGANGKMGASLITNILDNHKLILVGAIVAKDCEVNGEKVSSKSSIKFSSNLEQVIATCDVVIDFSTPQSTLESLAICAKYKKPIVVGTTGFDDQELSQLKSFSKQIPIVFAANFSVGVNLLLQLIEETARVLNNFDVEVIEAHHRHKVDAPSGTALKIGEVLAKNLRRLRCLPKIWANRCKIC